jgi:hypothetical protein
LSVAAARQHVRVSLRFIRTWWETPYKSKNGLSLRGHPKGRILHGRAGSRRDVSDPEARCQPQTRDPRINSSSLARSFSISRAKRRKRPRVELPSFPSPDLASPDLSESGSGSAIGRRRRSILAKALNRRLDLLLLHFDFAIREWAGLSPHLFCGIEHFLNLPLLPLVKPPSVGTRVARRACAIRRVVAYHTHMPNTKRPTSPRNNHRHPAAHRWRA